MLSYKTETRPGLVAVYDIWPGNGAGPFLQPQNPHGVNERQTDRERERESSTWLAQSVTCMVRPSCSMRCLPALVHGAGASSSRRSRYLHTMNPDLPLSGQYFTTYIITINNNSNNNEKSRKDANTARWL